MDKQPQSQRKGILRLFKRRHDDPPKPPKPNDPSGSATGQPMPDVDTARTNARHQKACELLLACLPKAQQDDTWNFLDFSDVEAKSGTFDEEFSHKVDTILESKRGLIKDDDSWAKCCQTVECVFAALVPFSRNFLSIANQGQSVRLVLFSALTYR